VATWPQGQDSNRSRTIIASGSANTNVPASYFVEPGGPPTPAKATDANPPDQGRPKTKPTSTKPGARTAPPAKPGKGE
jgi:hypothetical protein